MKINNISLYRIPVCYNDKIQKNNTNRININFQGTPRVDKSMVRFYEANLERFPVTVKNFLDSLADKFKFTPLEAQKEAYIRLEKAKTIQDVLNDFPQETLFDNLKQLQDTKAAVGLLAIYREFKDLYENGILKSGEDLSVYLLKKIFLEAKTLDEINNDIDKDLNEDIRTEFKRRYHDNEYILSSTLKSLGIKRPDTEYQNSLRFTREGYSDDFGIKISQGQLKYWNSLTDEQKFDILSKRCEGRDNWWNNLTYDEKLELAAGVDSEDDLYKNYKRFVRAGKKEIREGKFEQTLERPAKKIKIGNANLKDKDVFNLWFRKNIEKFYSLLSEADKDSVHIKRVRKLVLRWQEMTPEERTELISKMREGREPLRYAMIDTWNHSRVLIRELSDYLKAQQILKPIDMLYDTQEFSEFQSKVMTEFWAAHKDLAEEFGKNLRWAISRVETSIQRGQFEDLKQEIMRDRAYRIKMLNWEKAAEEKKAKDAEIAKAKETEIVETKETIKTKEPKAPETNYKEEFRKEYRLKYNKNNYLPESYIDDIIDMMLEDLPQRTIEKLIKAYKSGSNIPEELLNEIEEKGSKQLISAKIIRNQRALEAAISNELCSKGANPIFFGMDSMSVNSAYLKRMKDNLPRKKTPDPQRVKRLYNEYKKDLTDKELKDIVNHFFILKTDDNLEENEKIIADYVSSYGKTALILFSDKSAFSNDVKIQFNDKFLRLMPKKMKEFCIPALSNGDEVIAEQLIKEIRGKIARRFDFLPDDVLNTYTQEVAQTIRNYRASDVSNKDDYSIQSFMEKMCKKRTKNDYEFSSSFIKIPKEIMPKNSKITVLAAEQALADELYRITGNEIVFGLEFEELCNAYEMFSFIKNDTMIIANIDKTLELKANIKPNKNKVSAKYREYIKELKDREEDIFDEYSIKDSEELVYALNPDAENEVRDNYIRNRIKMYQIFNT